MVKDGLAVSMTEGVIGNTSNCPDLGNCVSKQDYTLEMGKNKTKLLYSGHMEEKAVKTAQEQWRNEYTETIGRNVREYRDRIGISAQQLSDRTDKAGFRIPRSSIANIETAAKKSYPIHEMVTLASALGLPLNNLLANPYRPTELIRPFGNSTPLPAYLLGGSQAERDMIFNSGTGTEVTHAAQLIADLSQAYTEQWQFKTLKDDVEKLIAAPALPPHVKSTKEDLESLVRMYANLAEARSIDAGETIDMLIEKSMTWWEFENHVVSPALKRAERILPIYGV